jgi:chromosome segregation ATPase
MKKKLVLLSMAFALTLPAIPVLGSATEETAVTNASSRTRSEVQAQRQQAKNERLDLKENIQNGKSELAQQRLEFKDNKEKLTEEKCKTLETKIATRLNRYENNSQMTENVYGNIQTRLTKLLDKLKTAGADTKKFETDLATLQTKIDKLKADQATFLASLKETQAFVCGKSEGEFKTKLENSRKVPELIKADRQDVRSFFEKTLKADLKTIREFLAAQNTTTAPAPAAEPAL